MNNLAQTITPRIQPEKKLGLEQEILATPKGNNMFGKPSFVPKLALKPIMEIRTSIISDELGYRESM